MINHQTITTTDSHFRSPEEHSGAHTRCQQARQTSASLYPCRHLEVAIVTRVLASGMYHANGDTKKRRGGLLYNMKDTWELLWWDGAVGAIARYIDTHLLFNPQKKTTRVMLHDSLTSNSDLFF